MKDLDWENLTFAYRKTDYNVRCYYRDGKWGEIEVCSDEYIKLHMAAACLHYGQEAFEGLKALSLPGRQGTYLPCQRQRSPLAKHMRGYCHAQGSNRDV